MIEKRHGSSQKRMSYQINPDIDYVGKGIMQPKYYSYAKSAVDLETKEYWLTRVFHEPDLSKQITNEIMGVTSRSNQSSIYHDVDDINEDLLNIEGEVRMDSDPGKWVSMCVVLEEIFQKLDREQDKKIFIWLLFHGEIHHYIKKLDSTYKTFKSYFPEVEEWVKKATLLTIDKRNEGGLKNHAQVFTDSNLKQVSGYTQRSIKVSRKRIKNFAKGLW